MGDGRSVSANIAAKPCRMDTLGTALVVDHDPRRVDSLAALVRELGFATDVYTDALAAREYLHQRPDLDVILCEMDMEGLTWDSARDFFVYPVDDPQALGRSLQRCLRQRQVRRELEQSRQRLEATNTELRGTVKVLEQDQQAGRQVQLRMLPATPLVLGDYVFSHTVIPSLYLSGDFTDYFTVGEHHVTFFMADVSGHGSSSAFATVLLKNLFARKRSDLLRQNDDTIYSPVAMLKRANKELLDLGVGKFATMVVGVIDMQANTLCFSVAGHLPQPVLVSRAGARYLRGEGSAVGIMAEAEYEEHKIDLPASFMLALFSDGILEILPPKNLIEKEKYFLKVFEETADSPEELVTRLGLDRVDTAQDDIAALFISKRG